MFPFKTAVAWTKYVRKRIAGASMFSRGKQYQSHKTPKQSSIDVS